MTKSMKIDRANMENLRIEIEAALKTLGDKHGLIFKLGTGRYEVSGTGGRFTELTINQRSGDSDLDVFATYAKDFKRNAFFWDMKDSDLGRKFKDPLRGDVFKIVGARPRKSKPIVVIPVEGPLSKNFDVTKGRHYTMSAETVKNGLEKHLVA